MNTPLRTRLAISAGKLAAATSRLAGRGEGMIIGGKVALAVSPHALRDLAQGRVAALVSATNGKTSTTRLLATALSQSGPVASPTTGANMTEGAVWALATGEPGAQAVLEVDEAYLPRIVRETQPKVVLLANLSRDQLDRMSEVAMLARKWRAMIAENPDVLIIANADDPIVAYAAEKATKIVWVAAGQAWTADSSVCPDCGTLLSRDEKTWSCSGCGRSRPEPSWTFEWSAQQGNTYARAVAPDGQSFDLSHLGLPGRFNASNATMALAACSELGQDLPTALELMNTVSAVSGRFATVQAGALTVRLLLAKNPAGWSELLDIMPPAPTPVIVMINANHADGRDPSWLWDVPFERLAGRTVIASGNRRRDLAVRLLHAGVDAHVIEDPFAPNADLPDSVRALEVIDCAATYTAFQKIRVAALDGEVDA
ncbi:UDP-N-acetylmuramyl tripeptide synthase [Aurantimicrobium minutum]|uniref:Mur ligase family protein n=1 Tax=Aurantimicrobium minutum TaxID=708131 RepID=UPI00247596F8|nr:MurT ligase domain-containing protein [Aurantimicrobium minutum]MDH6532156.1 UDP-N-acetylmuramyl tripeptide synthase [Aurantimicrobium minutum]